MQCKKLGWLLGLIVVTHTSPTLAELKAEDEIKFRQSAYMFMRWNVGKIKTQVIEQPQRYNQAEVEAAATAIVAVANSGLGALFTEQSKRGKGWKETRVKAEFFQQPDDVKQLALDFKQQAEFLLTSTRSGDPAHIEAQFKKLIKACKACHKKFRSKD
ncbi:MAG: cytochrome c [Gammaproteobacteria bacterium]|nr:cytochrome c [Gammaproteobacteria bacterium]